MVLGKKQEKKESSKISLKKIREEIDSILGAFHDEVSEIMENLTEMKISFESLFSEVINPYGSSVRTLYDIKRGIERFRDEFLLNFLEYMATIPKLIFTDIKLIKKGGKDEDYVKLVGDSFRLYLYLNFYPEIFKDILNISGDALKIIEDFAKLLEEIGNQQRLIRDVYSEIIKKINDLSSKVSLAIKKIRIEKVLDENSALVFLYNNFDPKDPKKIAINSLNKFLEFSFDDKIGLKDFLDVLDKVKEEIRRFFEESNV